MFLLQLLSFKSQNCEVYFSNAFTLETRLSTSPVFIIYFFFYLMLEHWHGQKAYHVDDHYRRYGINLIVTLKTLCLLDQTRVEISNVLITRDSATHGVHYYCSWVYINAAQLYIQEFSLHLFIVTVCIVMVYKFEE